MTPKNSVLVTKLRTWRGKSLTHVVLKEAADTIERMDAEMNVLRQQASCAALLHQDLSAVCSVLRTAGGIEIPVPASLKKFEALVS